MQSAMIRQYFKALVETFTSSATSHITFSVDYYYSSTVLFLNYIPIYVLCQN